MKPHDNLSFLKK